MKRAVYHELREQFLIIKMLFSSGFPSNAKIDAALSELQISREKIAKRGSKREHKLLLYCIDTLHKFIKEGNREKTHSFAGLISNIPDIFSGRCDVNSLKREINQFNERYREACFDNIEVLHPRFYARAPRNALSFFSPKADEDFKARHPIGYPVLIGIGITALLLPLILFAFYAFGFDEEQGAGAWVLPAIIGCFMIGVGLFNIVAAFIRQYLGHRVTAVCFIVGGVIVGLSVFMIEHPDLYEASVSTYYLVSLFMLILPPIFYVLFRFSVASWLRRVKRVGRSRYNKLTKGVKNYCWYEKLHGEVNLGILYYLNKSFTIIYALTLVLTLLLGYIRFMIILLCPLNVITYVLCAAMLLFSRIQDNLDSYGKPFVLLAKNKNRGFDSFIFDLGIVVFAVLLAYVNLLLAADVFGIAR